MTHRIGPSRYLRAIIGAVLSLAIPSSVHGLEPEAGRVANVPSHAPAMAVEEETAPELPRWRFRDADRPVKVVVLAGSIGAYPRGSYADRLAQWCGNIEVQNLSKSGLGAWALKQRFREQVLENRRLSLPPENGEAWLIFGGGLNSVGTPERTNRWARDLFVLAHRAGMRVVALSLTPWGDEDDRRWRGASGVRYFEATRKVVDFILRRLSPEEALGSEVRRRPDPTADWQPDELADISVDLYDSSLRQAGATTRSVAEMRAALEADAGWQRAHRRRDDTQRARALQADAETAARLPQWYLRPEYRGFDHIHPNRTGHHRIAQEACPHLPESWGCRCPPLSAGG